VPTIVTIEVAVVVEFPAPVRVVIVGRLQALLPDEKERIVVLRMDVLGVIDFDAGTSPSTRRCATRASSSSSSPATSRCGCRGGANLLAAPVHDAGVYSRTPLTPLTPLGTSSECVTSRSTHGRSRRRMRTCGHRHPSRPLIVRGGRQPNAG
jgi:hypothetical protein